MGFLNNILRVHTKKWKSIRVLSVLAMATTNIRIHISIFSFFSVYAQPSDFPLHYSLLDDGKRDFFSENFYSGKADCTFQLIQLSSHYDDPLLKCISWCDDRVTSPTVPWKNIFRESRTFINSAIVSFSEKLVAIFSTVTLYDMITITPKEQGGEMVDNTNPAELVKEIAVVLEEITALESEINAILNEMENNGKELDRHNDEK